MAFYPSRKANPSSQKQKLVTDNFSGTLGVPAMQTLKSIEFQPREP
jgi:hypothetical protein